MNPRLLHLYGPFYINSYGVFIALGILIVILLAKRDTRYKALLTNEQLVSLTMYSILGGVFGGRLLYFLTNWNSLYSPVQILEFWQGGGSVLGSIIGIIAVVIWYAKKNTLPFFKLLDFFALYAPLLHSISRIGCFFAGCCFGKPSNTFFSVIYSHPDSIAPLCVPLHPAQLYSALILLFIFLLLYYAQDYYVKPGQTISFYLMLACTERFFIDFIRGDQEFIPHLAIPVVGNIFSINQWIALILLIVAIGTFFHVTFSTQPYESL
jgi:phosphatidylglycerol:prolipoprotein diacylglycerol transferase